MQDMAQYRALCHDWNSLSFGVICLHHAFQPTICCLRCLVCAEACLHTEHRRGSTEVSDREYILPDAGNRDPCGFACSIRHLVHLSRSAAEAP